MCICESWLNCNNILVFNVDGYTMASSYCRKKMIRGGCLILVKNNLKYKKREDIANMSIEQHFEVCCIELKNLIVLVVYRSPSSDLNIFMSNLEQCLEKITNQNHKTIIVSGDFNIRFSLLRDSRNILSDLFDSFLLKQQIFDFTRVVRVKGREDPVCSCIDNILTDSNIVKNARVIQGIKSDHLAQIVDIELNLDTVVPISCLVRKTSNSKMLILKQNLNEILPNLCQYTDYDTFFDEFLKTIDKCIPVTKMTGKNAFSRWATKGILVSRVRLFELYALLRIDDDPSLRHYVTKYSKLFKKVCLSAKKICLTQRIANSENKIKCVWQIINENTGKNVKYNVRCDKIIDKNGKSIYDMNEICNYFNEYFTNVAVNVTRNLECSLCESLKYLAEFMPEQDSNFIIGPISMTRIIKIIRALKSKNSNDFWFVTPNLIKNLECELAEPMAVIINSCIEQGIFPDQMKIAKVVPLHKKGSTASCDNYRPVSVLPSLSKIFEKYIAEELMDYLAANKILSERQFGFRKAKSTKHAIMRLIEDVFAGLETSQKTYGVFCDLSKAFDCVSHSILAGKLQHYGVRGKEIAILTSYLSNRQQVAELNGCRSGKCKINLGVPQGSILGPLLFLIYVNDVSVVFKDVDVVLFADDTSLIIKDKNNDIVGSKIKKSIYDLKQWFSINNMQLNVNKTNIIQFVLGSRSGNQIPESILNVMDDLKVSPTSHVKFLGVWLDSKLTWATHLEELTKRLCSACYAIKKIKELGGEKAARDVYFAYFHSLMTYGIVFWGTAAGSNRVFILQKRAVRYILGIRQLESCRNRFRELSILTMTGEFIYQNLIYVRENINVLTTVRETHNYNTRHKDRLLSHKTRLTKVLKSYICTSIKLYNKIPLDIRNMNDSSFKMFIKNHLIQKSYYKLDEAMTDKSIFAS